MGRRKKTAEGEQQTDDTAPGQQTTLTGEIITKCDREKEHRGIRIREGTVPKRSYLMTYKGYTLKLSEKLVEGDEIDIFRVLVSKISMDKTANHDDYPEAKAQFETHIVGGFDSEIRFGDFQAYWITTEKREWWTTRFIISVDAEKLPGKISEWRTKLAATEKAVQVATRGEIKVWLQHQMKLRPLEVLGKEEWDKHFDAFMDNLNEHIQELSGCKDITAIALV